MKSSQGLVKYAIGCWIHAGSTSVYTKEKHQSDHEVWGPPKSDMVQRVLQWERQKRCFSRKKQEPMAKKCYHNKILMEFFRGREDEDKRQQENGQIWFILFYFFKITFLGRVLKQPTHSLLGAWSFLLVHIWFTPSEEPKGFVIDFLRYGTMELGPWSRTMEKGRPPWSNFMVHGVNQPLEKLTIFNLYSNLFKTHVYLVSVPWHACMHATY